MYPTYRWEWLCRHVYPPIIGASLEMSGFGQGYCLALCKLSLLPGRASYVFFYPSAWFSLLRKQLAAVGHQRVWSLSAEQFQLSCFEVALGPWESMWNYTLPARLSRWLLPPQLLCQAGNPTSDVLSDYVERSSLVLIGFHVHSSHVTQRQEIKGVWSMAQAALYVYNCNFLCNTSPH